MIDEKRVILIKNIRQIIGRKETENREEITENIVDTISATSKLLAHDIAHELLEGRRK